MATVASTQVRGEGNRFIWTGLTEADTGSAATSQMSGDKTVQVSGTFGGGTVILEGSLDGTNYYTLSDPQGSALTFTSAGIKTVLEAVLFARPRVTAGTSVSLTVVLYVRHT